MKRRPKFDLDRATYAYNPVFIARLLDPYTAKMARFLYNIGFTANLTTLITFFLGMSAIAVMFLIPGFTGLLIAAILLMLRNLGDTIDGKIARGSGTTSPIGGFSDIVSDWIIFHAAFFVAIGYLTNNVALGFLCVTGYMSREFTRRQFTRCYGKKITETKTAKKIPFIVSLARRYDLASWFYIVPILLLINPVFIILATAIIEYTLLLGELTLDLLLLTARKK